MEISAAKTAPPITITKANSFVFIGMQLARPWPNRRGSINALRWEADASARAAKTTFKKILPSHGPEASDDE
jgi:hypothetical protein